MWVVDAKLLAYPTCQGQREKGNGSGKEGDTVMGIDGNVVQGVCSYTSSPTRQFRVK